MPHLILMRHGTTLWGQENRFAGWGDTPLSPEGHDEAAKAAQALQKSGLPIDLILTSQLTRAQQTVDHIPHTNISVVHDWRLNERHYGALQGERRADMVARYGNDEIVAWRRSFHAVPPPLAETDPRWMEQLKKFVDVPLAAQPCSESMAMAARRSEAVWYDQIAPRLRLGQNLLVVAHTSSLRGLSKVMLKLDDATAEAFRISTAVPRVYRLDRELNILSSEDMQSGYKSKLRSFINKVKPKRWGAV